MNEVIAFITLTQLEPEVKVRVNVASISDYGLRGNGTIGSYVGRMGEQWHLKVAELPEEIDTKILSALGQRVIFT